MKVSSDDSPPVAAAPNPASSQPAPRPVAAGAAEISGASRRLRALAALSGSLTDPLGPEDAASLVEQKALSALGATSAVVVTLGAFPPIVAYMGVPYTEPAHPTLHVVHAIGLPAEVKAALDELPLDAPVPFAEVARTGGPLFLSSMSELQRYPDWGTAMIGAGARAAAIVPVWANGELRGVLGLAWAEPRIFDEDERAFVLTLGVMCAQAIMRAYLRAAEQHARVDERQAREVAERANLSKAHFVATISHELRTPINAVMGYSELLSDEIYGPVSPLQRDHLGRLHASGKHLLDLIEDLLSYARVEAGEAIVRPETVSMADIVDQSLLLVRPIAERKGLQIRVEDTAEPIELYTDVRKLRQVLANVIANAVKFTDMGNVALLLRRDGEGAQENVFFEVTDQGIGIATEDHEHVFDAFWQRDPTSKNTAGSSGLGLSVSRQLARLLGGDVTIAKSGIGQGSTFVVWIPARFPVAATAF